MGRQGGGRLRTSIVDTWYRQIDAQPRPEPIQPRDHLNAAWCAHGWACRACPDAEATRPDQRKEPPCAS